MGTFVARMSVVVMVALGVAGCASENDDPETAISSSVDELGKADKIDCSYVKCAMPLCAQGQHLTYQGGCCPVCVGAPSRCATVLCAAVTCGEGEIAVTPSGQCCPRCVKAPQVKECQTDLDCPQYACFACPCPVSSCRGNKCVTSTPDASTCGGNLQ